MALSEPQPRARLPELTTLAAEDADEADEPTDEEVRWMFRVQRSLEQTPEALGAPAKVFNVPQTLRGTKPESYTPHVFALGPYHHARPELMDMERFKLAGAKRLEMLFAGGRKMEHLMERFLCGAGGHNLEHKIRSTYHRTLNLNGKTLAWMMAIDACFLLDFIDSCHRNEPTATDVLSSSANWTNAVICDAMMLENQVPLFVLANALELRHATRHDAARALHATVDRFIKDVSPIKIIGSKPAVAIGDPPKRAHLLEVLYQFLVPDAILVDDGNGGGGDQEQEEEPQPMDEAELEEVISHDDDMDHLNNKPPPLQEEHQQQGFDKMKQVLSLASRLNIAPVRFLKKQLLSKPMALVSSLSGKMARKAPALAALVPVFGKLGQSVDVEAQVAAAAAGAEDQAAPRADEIHVPSVEQLARCGVRFVPAPEGVAGIRFDAATATLRLPVVVLDANTEAVLRNLVAYEAVAARGPLALARYTELMNGIVDTPRDVKILRRSGVVVSRMRSNKEAAGMWNAMARAARPSRVPRIDAAIAAVNAHRGRSAAARAEKLLRRYVFGSWKVLTLLASVGLLVMTALQTFCSAYPCENHWFAGVVLPPGTGADDPAAR